MKETSKELRIKSNKCLMKMYKSVLKLNKLTRENKGAKRTESKVTSIKTSINELYENAEKMVSGAIITEQQYIVLGHDLMHLTRNVHTLSSLPEEMLQIIEETVGKIRTHITTLESEKEE